MIRWGSRRRRLVLDALGVVGLMALAKGTQDRVPVWESEQALWAAAVEQAPQKPRGWINLGVAHARAGRYWEATVAFHVAERRALDPSRPVRERQITARLANLNLAQVAMWDSNWREAWIRVERGRDAPWTSDRASVAQHRAVADHLHLQLVSICGGPCDAPF